MPAASATLAPGRPLAALARSLWPTGGVAELGALALVGAGLSWACTGHVFGYNNNVFHLPIVAGLAQQPGFEHDTFVQSLRSFSSGLWIVLAGSDARLPAPALFAALLFLSKALCILGLLLVAGELGLQGRKQRLAFVAMMATTPLLLGIAYAGHGGLFINYFSHSELANGCTLLVWWAGLRRRFGWALALNGLVFFLNAFMAMWNLVPLLWLVARALGHDREAWRRQLPGLAAGGLAAALLAWPVLARVLAGGVLFTSSEAGAAGLDLRAFLVENYPYHFLPGAMPATQWLGLAAVLVAAVLGLYWLGRPARPLAHVLAAYVLVYAAGMVLPALTAAPGLLKLHLLRVSVNFHFIAAIALGLCVVQGFSSAQPLRRWLWAPLLAAATLTVRPALVLVLLWPALRRLPWPAWRAGPQVFAVTLGAGVVAWQVFAVIAAQAQAATLQRSIADWGALAQAVGERTVPGAQVLLPLKTDDWRPLDGGSGVFEYRSHRPVWVDAKRGAAVLWQPAYHAEWQARSREVAALDGWPQRLDYAAGHGIAMVVDRCHDLPAEAAPQVAARVGRLCAVRALREAPAGP